MKRLFILLMFSIILVGCGGNDEGESKVYGLGEEVTVSDKYSLTIDKVNAADNFEYQEDFTDPEQIIEVTYTYKNIDQEDALLYIHGQDLQVIDGDNKVAEASDMFPKKKPRDASVGTAVTVNSYYGLENKSKEITIILRSEMYNEEIEYRIPIQE